MKWDTLIEHKEVLVVCEVNGLVNMNYNALLITPYMSTIVKPIILVSTKSTLTYTNYGKIGHSIETFHN